MPQKDLSLAGQWFRVCMIAIGFFLWSRVATTTAVRLFRKTAAGDCGSEPEQGPGRIHQCVQATQELSVDFKESLGTTGTLRRDVAGLWHCLSEQVSPYVPREGLAFTWSCGQTATSTVSWPRTPKDLISTLDLLQRLCSQELWAAFMAWCPHALASRPCSRPILARRTNIIRHANDSVLGGIVRMPGDQFAQNNSLLSSGASP